MRSLFSCLVLIVFLIAPMSQAAESKMDFSGLKEGIRGYRALTNTPDAPDVVFTNQHGKEFTLADFKGKIILLNFWATWCPPCIREMPALNELAKEFKDKDFIVIAIASGRQGREGADEFLQKRKLTSLQSYLDPEQNFMRLMGIDSLPVSFIIDAEGKMQGGVIGMSEWDSPEAKTVLRELLNQKNTKARGVPRSPLLEDTALAN
jgi:thiol-disulfide isomerase/thioredoxin